MCGLSPLFQKGLLQTQLFGLLWAIRHVLDSACLFLKLFALLLVIIGRLDKTGLAGGVQIEIVFQALISGICYYIFIPCPVESLQPPQKRLESLDVTSVRKNLYSSDILTVYPYLNIIFRLELAISHMIFLHLHKSGILVGF